MTPPITSSPAAITFTPLRPARVAAIAAGTQVRAALGQSALHRLVDGQHEVTVCGQVFVDATVAEVIDAVRRQIR